MNDFSPLAQDYTSLFYLKEIRKEAEAKRATLEWGEVWVNKMIKKWKKKYSYVTKSDFPKYTTRYSCAHGDVIKMVINGDLDSALITAATVWASLPDSTYGQEHSSYSIIDAKKV